MSGLMYLTNRYIKEKKLKVRNSNLCIVIYLFSTKTSIVPNNPICIVFNVDIFRYLI